MEAKKPRSVKGGQSETRKRSVGSRAKTAKSKHKEPDALATHEELKVLRAAVPELTAEHVKTLLEGKTVPDGVYRFTGSLVLIRINKGSMRLEGPGDQHWDVEFDYKTTPRERALAALLSYLSSWVTGEAKKQSEVFAEHGSARSVALRIERSCGVIRITGNPHQVVESLRSLLARERRQIDA